MSRYWDAASDLDAYPPQDNGYWGEMDRALDEDREKLAALQAEQNDFDHFLTGERRARHGAESARRQALFQKAGMAMKVMVTLRGVYGPNPPLTAWYGRHGRRLGLFTYYDNDHELQWEPRRGFRLLEKDIPF